MQSKTRYEPFLRTELQILEVLALEKEFAQYDLPKRIGKNYRTVLRHVHNLTEEGLIQVSRTEESKKGGKDRNIFTLTCRGLRLALTGDELGLTGEKVWENIDDIARNYADELPLIFGKWDFFIKKGLRDTIIARLQAAIVGFLIQLGREWVRIVEGPSEECVKVLIKYGGREKAEMTVRAYKQVVGDLTDSVLGFSLFLHPKHGDKVKYMRECMQLIQVLREDPEIERYFRKQFELREKSKKHSYENARAWNQWYKRLGDLVSPSLAL